jgi:hypothetical protein
MAASRCGRAAGRIGVNSCFLHVIRTSSAAPAPTSITTKATIRLVIQLSYPGPGTGKPGA